MPQGVKRKAPDADPPPPSHRTAIPSALPPSVEEAYRRKCIQLRNRTNEVEDANDAARLRLARIKRQVEKLRIERAFLLEQLAKRTSTNVEDSDGSPSPPPTDATTFAKYSELDANPRKPKDKPLRTKRGHRKAAAEGADAKAPAGASFNTTQAQSPTSESFSQAADGQTKGARANGVSKSDKKPADAFELYCKENRAAIKDKIKDDDANLDEELAKAWEDLAETEKEEYKTKFESMSAKEEEEPKEDSPSDKKKEHDAKPEDEKPSAQDEDVEMTNYDTEGDHDAPSGDKAE